MTFARISSVQNPRVKNAVRLRSRRARNQQGRFLVDGTREIERAARAGIAFETVFLGGEQAGEPMVALARKLAERGAEVLLVAPAVWEKVAYGNRAPGMVAVARTPRTTLDEMCLTAPGPIVVLEGIEKPGNVGAVLRSADAAGAAAVIVADGVTDLYNPNAIRASLGAVFSLPVCAARSAPTRDWLRQSERTIYATRVGAAANYADVALGIPCALVLGSESEGLSDIWRGPDITDIALPMLGVADSLNVSVTAAVLLYESLRQRQRRGTD
jgi:TrmH family RNA methyltransferase